MNHLPNHRLFTILKEKLYCEDLLIILAGELVRVVRRHLQPSIVGMLGTKLEEGVPVV